jgi:serine protease Do
VILEAGGKHVSSPSDLREVLSTAKKNGKSVVLLRLKSGDSNRFVTLPVKHG